MKTIIQIIYILSFLTLFTFKNESSYDYPPFVFTFCILSAHLPHKSVKTDHAYNFQVKKSLLDGFIFLNAKDNMVTGKHKPTTSYLHKLPNFEHFSYNVKSLRLVSMGVTVLRFVHYSTNFSSIKLITTAQIEKEWR